MQEQYDDPSQRPPKYEETVQVVAPMPTTPTQRTTADLGTVGGTEGGGGSDWTSWLAKYVKKLFGGGGDAATSAAASATTSSLLSEILKDPQTYKDLIGSLGGIAGGSATERGRENVFGTDYNRSVVGRYGVEQDAALNALLAAGRDKMTGYGYNQIATTSALKNQSDENLARAELGLRAPTTRAQQSVRGSMMQNLQPRTITVPPGQRGHEWGSRGGLNASVLSPMTRQHGGELMKDALNAQLTKSDVPAATDFMGGVLAKPEPTDYSKALIKPPELTPYQDPGKLESVTSGVGTGLDWLKIFLDARKRNAGGTGTTSGGGYGPGNSYPGPT